MARWRTHYIGSRKLDGAAPTHRWPVFSSSSSVWPDAVFAIHPTALLPPEDQGYCIVLRRGFPPALRSSRVRQVSADIDAVLKNVPGIKGWVTIGGYSVADSANLSNVVTMFVMYRGLGQATTRIFPRQDRLPELQKNLYRFASARLMVLLPSPIPGLGQAGGFQMMVEDRAGVGLGQLEKTGAANSAGRATTKSGLHGVTTTFNSKSPQLKLAIDRTMAESLGVTMNDIFQTLQTILGSTYVNLFNKFNQSFQVRMQADADYRKRLDDIANLYVANRSGQMVPLGALVDVRRMLGSELITRYNLYPAAPLLAVLLPDLAPARRSPSWSGRQMRISL